MTFTNANTIIRMTTVSLFLIIVTGTQGQDQHPILDKLADKVIQKYQGTSCQDLEAKKAAKTPPTPEEQKAIQFLKNDPQSRTYFINKIAPPIANKLFDCGMIP